MDAKSVKTLFRIFRYKFKQHKMDKQLVTTDDEELKNAEAAQNAESDDEDSYYENPLEIIREFGNNPYMERAQNALKRQLKETSERLEKELRRHVEEQHAQQRQQGAKRVEYLVNAVC